MLFCSTETLFTNAIVDWITHVRMPPYGDVTKCWPRVVNGISGGYMVFLCMTRAPSSKNSLFDTHIRRKVPNDAKIEPPIHVVYKRSWGAKIYKKKTITVYCYYSANTKITERVQYWQRIKRRLIWTTLSPIASIYT